MATLEYALKTNSGDIIAVVNHAPETRAWEKICGSDDLTVFFGQPEAMREYMAMPAMMQNNALWIVFGDDKGNAKQTLMIARKKNRERYALLDCKTGAKEVDLLPMARDNMMHELMKPLNTPKAMALTPENKA